MTLVHSLLYTFDVAKQIVMEVQPLCKISTAVHVTGDQTPSISTVALRTRLANRICVASCYVSTVNYFFGLYGSAAFLVNI
jgi:hypothetical protein